MLWLILNYYQVLCGLGLLQGEKNQSEGKSYSLATKEKEKKAVLLMESEMESSLVEPEQK